MGSGLVVCGEKKVKEAVALYWGEQKMMQVRLRSPAGGWGGGQQAAVLAAMGLEVYSIEIVPELAGIAYPTADSPLLTVRHLLTMTAGLLLKTALFPLHFWLPAAHSNAPAPVSAAGPARHPGDARPERAQRQSGDGGYRFFADRL